MASVYTILSNCFRYDITTSPQENGYDVRVERYRMSEHNLGVPCTTVIQQSIFSTRKKYRVDNTKQLNLLLYIHKRFKVPSRACFDILKYSSGKHVEIIYNEDGSITLVSGDTIITMGPEYPFVPVTINHNFRDLKPIFYIPTDGSTFDKIIRDYADAR